MKPEITLVQITASRSFGGPERQMFELARELAPQVRTVFVSFSEGGLCRPFIDKVRAAGLEGIELKRDTPRLLAAARELAATVGRVGGQLLIGNGYKSNLLGLIAGRRLGLPVVAVVNGWTAESLRVRVYEAIDRRVLRRMDRAICVSAGQVSQVRAAGVAPS